MLLHDPVTHAEHEFLVVGRHFPAPTVPASPPGPESRSERDAGTTP